MFCLRGYSVFFHLSTLTIFFHVARMLDGDEESQIGRLYDYRLELRRTNERSTVKFKCNEGVFAGMCLGPLKARFLEGCRPIISLDGCFLKGLYGGQLLSAVGIDGNDNIYPFAWAVVAKENREYWQWFLELLAEDIGIHNSHQWAFMTDRQKVGFILFKKLLF